MKNPIQIFLVIFIISSYSLHATAQRRIKISFVGDIMMHDAVKKCAVINNRGFDYLFSRIRKEFLKSDIVLGNLEFPISPPFLSNGIVFNCLPDILPALKKAGIKIVNLANNHILDQGATGIIDTLKYLFHNDIMHIGVSRKELTAREGLIYRKHGLRVGFIAYTGILNFPYPKSSLLPLHPQHPSLFFIWKSESLSNIDFF